MLSRFFAYVIILLRGDSMNGLYVLFLVLIGIGAGFVQRVTGFGLGIFAMVFLPHFMPAQSAAAISCLFSCVTSSYNAVRYRRNIAYRTALPMVAAALLLIPVAVYFSKHISGNGFHVLLGSVLILLSLYFLVFHKHIKMKPTLSNGILAGAVGGTLNGLFSTGGPPIVLYLSCAMSDKDAYFATIQFYFCFTNLYATAMRVVNGMIDAKILLYAAIGVIGCMTGDCIGRLVFDRLDSGKLKRIIYIGMIISGILMFF